MSDKPVACGECPGWCGLDYLPTSEGGCDQSGKTDADPQDVKP